MAIPNKPDWSVDPRVMERWRGDEGREWRRMMDPHSADYDRHAQGQSLAERRKGPPKCYDCRWFVELDVDSGCRHPKNEDLIRRGEYRLYVDALRNIDDDVSKTCGFAGRWFEVKEEKPS